MRDGWVGVAVGLVRPAAISLRKTKESLKIEAENSNCEAKKNVNNKFLTMVNACVNLCVRT
jgi:hypothetical protein